MWRVKLGVAGFVLIAAIGIFANTFAMAKIEGHEVGVRQHLTQGVVQDVFTSGTHFYNGWMWDVHVYNIGTQKITFDAAAENPDAEYGRIAVEVGENGGQRAEVAISVNYHINPVDVVKLHKQGIGKTYENVVLKREIVDTVNEIARPAKSALDIYSGAGFVRFKNEVDAALKNNAVLKDRGIDVENTIIYGVHLDPAYEQEIAAKQIAQQQVLRKQEETKAAEQEAKRIFAFSQAKVEEARQVAEASKITEVTAAEAQARKTVLDAEAERDSNLARSAGELAIGKARAEVKKLESVSLYEGDAGTRRAQVEIAKYRADAAKGLFEGTKILPSNLAAIGASVLGIEEESRKAA